MDEGTYKKYYERLGISYEEACIAEALDELHRRFEFYNPPTQKHRNVMRSLKIIRRLKRILGLPNEAFFHGLRRI